MTGPRSRGCVSCVQRRVKCDETRPLCQRCAKAGLKCMGYARPLTIVNENTRVARAGLSKPAARAVPDAQLKGLMEARTAMLMQRTWERSRILQRAHLTWQPVAGVQPSMLTADVFMGFLLDKIATQNQRGSTHEDIVAMARLAPSPTAALSLEALSAMFFGKTQVLPRVTQHAKATYSRALRSLVLDLQAAPSLATLAAMTALTMYELIAFTTAGAWVDHGRGVARYLQLLGPEAFKTRPMRSLLSQNRVLVTAEAVMRRQRTFFAEPRWRTVPWEDDPESKDAMDDLCDILSDIACISADVDALMAYQRDVTRIHIELAALSERLDACFKAQEAWWREWYAEHEGKIWRVAVDPATTLCMDQSGLFFPNRLEFDNFWTCYTLMTHDSARVLLVGLRKQLAEEFGVEHLSTPPKPACTTSSGLAGSTDDADWLVRQVMECMDYCERQNKDFATTFCIMFPLWVAANHWRDDSRESDWMCRVCKVEEDHVVGFVAGNVRVSVRRMTPSEQAAPPPIVCG